MNELETALQNLKDIHVPEPIGWWPPAPGWWLLLVAFVVLSMGLARYMWRRKRLVRTRAKRELDKIWRDYLIQKNEKRFLQDISILLRRVALSVDAREKVAALTGEEWLTYLDEGITGQDFSQGSGRVLMTAPYERKEPECNPDAIYLLVNRWVNKVPC